MSTKVNSYEKLLAISREAAALQSIGYLLEWDQETYMPRSGNEHRAEQLALIASLAHEKITSEEVGELLEACAEETTGNDPLAVRSVNLRELRRRYDRQRKLPRRLVEELARTASLSHNHWIAARRHSDFEAFQPWLEKMVSLKRQQAEAYGYIDSPYDALLEDYEPGENEKNLERVFSALGKALPPLIERITAAARSDSALTGEFPVERQRIFGEMAAAAIGFDFGAGRLDEVVHPFCTTVGPGDVRITTRFDSRNFAQAFFGILHEAGHGLYEQGLERAHFGTPMGETVSLAIHESQSRLWENIVGRGEPFWWHFLPRARGVFHSSLAEICDRDFLRAINRVERSLIRVEADEVTYNLHIILRFELERAMVKGELAPADLPGAWNDRFSELIGLKIPDDSRGCLQDTHWSVGLIGYFPTYALGNLYAAQFYARAKQDVPDLEDSFSAGDFSGLLGWLRGKIHIHGMRYRAGELVKVVTGRPLDPSFFLNYLCERYGALYDLDLEAKA